MKEGKNILLYRASAGSGKTYTLAKEYMDLLMKAYDSDKEAYKHILAVTFTNKATGEMKSRILQMLNTMKLSSEAKESKIAGDILSMIVHDYSMFKVSTIDSFFQGVLRAFAMELGAKSSYSTSLDNDAAIDAAVENMYSSLGEGSSLSSPLLSMLTRIALKNIDNEKGWDARPDISAHSKVIFTEDYKRICAKCFPSGVKKSSKESAEEIETLKQRLKSDIIKSFERDIAALYDDGSELFERSGVTKNAFIKQSNSPIFKFFTKRGNLLSEKNEVLGELPFTVDFASDENSYIRPAASDDEKKMLSDLMHGECGGKLCKNLLDCIGQIHDLFVSSYSVYISAKQILEDIDYTALYGIVRNEIDRYCAEQQISLLSDAPDLLNKLIDGSDAPFVYEKTGSYINDFLIDEFQDTSRGQWQNFKPLLQNSISSGYENLIVGDVKQSIYRWRGGDWSILNSSLNKDFPDRVKDINLDKNYRSLANIVSFNNAFFSASGGEDSPLANAKAYVRDQYGSPDDASLCNLITDIYSDSKQKLPEDKCTNYKGVVQVVSVVTRGSGIPFKEFVLEDMCCKIKQIVCEDKKYRWRDIAVLVGSNDNASNAAAALYKHEIPVISSESLYIANNPAVRSVINLLKRINRPSDLSAEAESILYPDEISADVSGTEGLSKLPLYEICQKIISDFLSESLKKEVIYLQAFMDKVLDYSMENGSSPDAFLKWWQDESAGFTVPAPSDDNAVRIMTMHKAKGLAFNVVFIPFLREDLITYDGRHSRSVKFWCSTDNDKIGYRGPVQLRFRHDLYASLFKNEFAKECLDSAIDTLNLAYVSFTRAAERLYIYAGPNKVKQTGSSMSMISSLLDYFCIKNSSADGLNFRQEKREKQMAADDNSEGEKVSLEYEKFTLGDENEDSFCLSKEPENASVAESETYKIESFVSYPSIGAELKNDIFEDEEDDNPRLEGIVMHKLYSLIDECVGKTLDEKISEAADSIAAEGTIGIVAESKEELVERVRKQIASVSEYSWFSDKYKEINEADIICGDTILRPDRILISAGETTVVDYKFGRYSPDTEDGAAQHKKYCRQVQRYMNVLSKMGYYGLKGYLWYVSENKVIEVSQPFLNGSM